MKIEDKRFSELCLFNELARGEVFVDCDEKIYMKINSIQSNYDGNTYNAVRVESGISTHFGDDEEVRTINAKVVIE